MKNLNDILGAYTAGAVTLEDANSALEAAGFDLRLSRKRNYLTPEELQISRADSPETATGWGLLDTGTGSLDDVSVLEGQLVNCDCGEMFALCYIAGKVYQVKGRALVEPEEV